MTENITPTFPINAASSNSYPYVTKGQVKDRLESDADFRIEALLVLYRRQTTDEQEAKDTKHKNRRGFMSSHAVHGTRIAELVISGAEISDEDQAKLDGIVVRYSKQLAGHYRAEQVMSLDAEAVEATRAKFGV